VFDTQNIKFEGQLVYGISYNSTSSSDFLSTVIYGFQTGVVGLGLKEKLISIPLNFQSLHKIFHKINLSCTEIYNFSSDAFLNFLITDPVLKEWLSNEFKEPHDQLKNQMLAYGMIHPNDKSIKGLIGMNYLKDIQITKSRNSILFNLND
jgi:hypothetical protein